MSDDEGPDAKILAVPAADPRWDHIGDIDDVGEFLRAEIGHFFEIYKALEPSRSTRIHGWADCADALAEIESARTRHTASRSR